MVHSYDALPMEPPSDLLPELKKAVWKAVHENAGLIDLFQAEMAARAVLAVLEDRNLLVIELQS